MHVHIYTHAGGTEYVSLTLPALSRLLHFAVFVLWRVRIVVCSAACMHAASDAERRHACSAVHFADGAFSCLVASCRLATLDWVFGGRTYLKRRRRVSRVYHQVREGLALRFQ